VIAGGRKLRHLARVRQTGRADLHHTVRT
jgi:hypothetical protein